MILLRLEDIESELLECTKDSLELIKIINTALHKRILIKDKFMTDQYLSIIKEIRDSKYINKFGSSVQDVVWYYEKQIDRLNDKVISTYSIEKENISSPYLKMNQRYIVLKCPFSTQYLKKIVGRKKSLL